MGTYAAVAKVFWHPTLAGGGGGELNISRRYKLPNCRMQGKSFDPFYRIIWLMMCFLYFKNT